MTRLWCKASASLGKFWDLELDNMRKILRKFKQHDRKDDVEANSSK